MSIVVATKWYEDRPREMGRGLALGLGGLALARGGFLMRSRVVVGLGKAGKSRSRAV